MKEVTDAESWHYRGEGAANVVLAYHGDDPAMIGKVLRLRKAVKGDQGVSNGVVKLPILTVEEQRIWADWPALIAATTTAELNHSYAQNVLCPLLDPEHVDPGTLVYVSSSFVEAVNSNISHVRPAWRAKSGSVDSLSGIGLFISDHTYFPLGNVQESSVTISVELKPKCGFLPTSSFIRKENEIKKRVSRFTMHQHLKFEQGKIKHISKYDPLELFSGTKEGILRAVQALFQTPQNNLRIFLNGQVVFGDNSDLIQVEDVLQGFVTAQGGERVQALQEVVADLLYESDILPKLLAVQKLDYDDIEGVMKAYSEFRTHLESLSANSVKRTLKDCIHGKAIEDSKLHSVETQLRTERQLLQDFEDCRKKLQNFLISTTAKDCGIMLTLQPLRQRNVDCISSNTGSIVTSSDQQYLHKIFLLDLDVKRLKKLNHYMKLDQEIVELFKASLIQ